MELQDRIDRADEKRNVHPETELKGAGEWTDGHEGGREVAMERHNHKETPPPASASPIAIRPRVLNL